jgi:hypothetical protein
MMSPASNPQRPLRPAALPVSVVNRYAIGPALRVLLDESDQRRRRGGRGLGCWHNYCADLW